MGKVTLLGQIPEGPTVSDQPALPDRRTPTLERQPRIHERRGAGFVARLLLGGTSVLLALVLAEIALRVLPLPDLRVLAAFQAPPGNTWKDPAWSDPPDRAFRRQRVIGHEHSPNVDLAVPLVEHSGGSFQFHTNNLGLRRDADTPTEKGANLFRVLVLGDSQTDGYVDNPESFSNRLEIVLGGAAELAGRRVEVLNAGVAGYSPAQEFLWYDVHGAELKPDLTIVMFYPGNDALDLLDPSKPDVNVATGRAIAPREDFPSYENGGPLSQLRLGLLARYTVQVGPLSGLWRQLGLPGRLTEAGGYPTDTLVQVFRTCHGCYLQSLQQAARARREPQPMQNAISHAAAILIRLDREVQENGGRLVVAVLPTRAQVEPELARPSQRVLAGLLGLDEAALGFEDEVSEKVVDLLTAGGVPTVLLEEPLKAAGRQRAADAPASGSTMTQPDSVDSAQALYYSRDWHLNPSGHRAAADALARGLTESRLVGVRPGGPPSPQL